MRARVAVGLLGGLLAIPALAQNPVTPEAVNGGIYLSTAPVLADQQKNAFRIDQNGNLLINCWTGCSGGGGGGGNVTIVSPLGSQLAAASVAVVLATNAILPLPTGASTSALQTTGNGLLSTINMTLGTPFQAGGSIGNSAFGISGTLPAFAAIPTFKIDQTTPGTTNAVSVTNFPATQPVSGSVSVSNFPATQAVSGTVTANQGTSPWVTQGVTGTTGGALIAGALAPNNTTAVVVKASPGQVYGIDVFNNSATIAYLKIYDATTATCGSGTPKSRYLIPGSTSGAGLVPRLDVGDKYATGIVYCLTTGISDTDTTAPAANTYLVNIHYQ